MRTPFLMAVLAAAASASELSLHSEELRELWNTWKSLHQKTYTLHEDTSRFSTFVENYILVVEHNKQKSDVKLVLNEFADMTNEEFRAHYTGLNRPYHNLREENQIIDYSILALPDAVDWRDKGAVTGVKNQQQCGSCWAFSATGALEGLNFINSGKLTSFSEQQLVDCEKDDQGCNGGEMDNAFKYAAANGMETEEDYPYTGRDGTCKFDASKAQKVNTGFKKPDPKNVDALKAAIAVQPVSVAVEANIFFQLYGGGVFHDFCGSGAELNHGILAVGYGTFDGKEAFIVKNSWGGSWGEKGYIRISTDGKINDGAGVCGILLDNSYPTA